MKNETVFKRSDLRPLIRFNKFEYVGCHDVFGDINYYIREYDKHNNYELMEARIEGLPKKLFNKYVLGAGTNIKIIDGIMYDYLKHRKEIEYFDKKFISKALNAGNYDEEFKKFYSTKVPKEIKETDFYKNNIKDGFKLLYVMNNEGAKEFATVHVVLAKQLEQEWIGTDLSYVLFKLAEFTVKPSYLKKKSKDKYHERDLPDINIPVSILK